MQKRIRYMEELQNRDFLIREITEDTEQFVSFVKEMNCVLNHRIEPLPDELLWMPFVVSHSWCYEASVNVFEISGTGNPSYQNMCWIDLLLEDRIQHNFRMLRKNPEYYFNGRIISPLITFIKINDQIFVQYKGNKRTAIAKAMFFFLGKTELRGVELHAYSVKDELKKIVSAVQKLLSSIDPAISFLVKRKCTARIDAAGWMKDVFEIFFEVENKRTAKKLVLKEEELVPFFYEAVRFKQSRWRRFLPRNRYTEVL